MFNVPPPLFGRGGREVRQIGSVEVPQEAFLAILKLND